MKIVKQLSSWLSSLLIVLIIFLAYGSLDNRWYRVITVEGNSMSPTMWIGDLMIVTPAPQNVNEIPENTIVVMNADGGLVTHRLLGFYEDGRPITKGDANESIDAFSNPNIRIVGVYRLHIPKLGYPLIYLNQILHHT